VGLSTLIAIITSLGRSKDKSKTCLCAKIIFIIHYPVSYQFSIAAFSTALTILSDKLKPHDSHLLLSKD